MTTGIFHAYGLFWRSDEINWHPGKGAKGEFMLLGRQGWNRGSIRAADFRHQNGIYILYGNHGPHYVGLTRSQGLGKRLKDHLRDRHANEWDRFSWFGFGKVLKTQDQRGLRKLADVPVSRILHPTRMIGDIEALLIKAMALRNVANMRFAHAEQWHQVKLDEVDGVLERIS